MIGRKARVCEEEGGGWGKNDAKQQAPVGFSSANFQTLGRNCEKLRRRIISFPPAQEWRQKIAPGGRLIVSCWARANLIGFRGARLAKRAALGNKVCPFLPADASSSPPPSQSGQVSGVE